MLKDELFESRIPKSPFIQQYIAYYYFHESGKNTDNLSFIYYPHYKNALTIYKGSIIRQKNDFQTVTSPHDSDYFFSFAKLTRNATKAQIRSPFQRIGVVFQPLGLNHFLDGNLSEVINSEINLNFNYFRESMVPFLDQIYATTALDQKVQLLDEYFTHVYVGFDCAPMKKATQLLFSERSKYTVEDLAKDLEISRKTVLRLFKKHHNCSPIDYIKLIQFRRSLEIYQQNDTGSSLTNLALNNAYYDHADVNLVLVLRSNGVDKNKKKFLPSPLLQVVLNKN